jgi:hypothetical protein
MVGRELVEVGVIMIELLLSSCEMFVWRKRKKRSFYKLNGN